VSAAWYAPAVVLFSISHSVLNATEQNLINLSFDQQTFFIMTCEKHESEVQIIIVM
jgi:hypothetical protein